MPEPDLASHAPCEREGCQTLDLAALHSGYVLHRRNGEDACDRSREGHRLYTQQKRLERTKQ